MATIAITRCPGGNHVFLTVTEAWGTHVIHVDAAAIREDARVRGDRDLVEDVKKVVKQSGANTANQIKNAIEGASFIDTDNVPSARDYP
jgi:hypothetical protein